jgi:ethanolamine utilization protein EutN
MRIARVIGAITATDKHECYHARNLLLVQRLTLDRRPLGFPTMAVDYMGAGPGDLVLIGAAPGLAAKVLKYPKAPVQQLIMGIVDRVELERRRGESEPPPKPT